MYFQKGYNRLLVDGDVVKMEAVLDGEAELKAKQDLHLLVDRLVTKENDENCCNGWLILPMLHSMKARRTLAAGRRC